MDRSSQRLDKQDFCRKGLDLRKKTKDVYLWRRENPIAYYINKKKGCFIFASTISILSESVDVATYQNSELISEDRVYKIERDHLVDMGSLKKHIELTSSYNRPENQDVSNPFLNRNNPSLVGGIVKTGNDDSDIDKVNERDIAIKAIDEFKAAAEFERHYEQLKFLLSKDDKTKMNRISLIDGTLVVVSENTDIVDAIKKSSFKDDISIKGSSWRLEIKPYKRIEQLLAEVWNVVTEKPKKINTNSSSVPTGKYPIILGLKELQRYVDLQFNLMDNGVEITLTKDTKQRDATEKVFKQKGVSFSPKHHNVFIKYNGHTEEMLVKALRTFGIIIYEDSDKK